MKTNRELLELAAKWAEIVGEYVENHHVITDCGSGRVTGIMVDKETCWNPLEDDGDRYRLIKKLEFCLDFETGEVWKNGECETWESGDEAHAVLRLAARIGESK
jgi:hypothetical protein